MPENTAVVLAETVPLVSGSYVGSLSSAPSGTQRLHLRIDVDNRIEQGAVLNRVSGDIFRIDRVTLPGRPSDEAEIYEESWIVEVPTVERVADAVVITGSLRYWNAVHPKTNVIIRVPLATANVPVEVTLSRSASPPLSFSCSPAGRFFRSLHLEVDVCRSVNQEPIVPVYGTHGLRQRPPNTPKRLLTIERSFGEAGVEVIVRDADRTIIDDSAQDFQAWSEAELHSAMEDNFSTYQGLWPQWEMWGLLAGSYIRSNVGGIMFDYAAAPGEPGRAPERQGFAVFRKHAWFKDLRPHPRTEAQHVAARKYLHTWVHEAGHAFNLLHSWDKNRASSLSFMNYDWRFDQLHGEGAYWKSFRFRFDDEELTHIRHGNRSSVIMGGDPWSSGGHAESPPGAEHLRMPPGAMVSVAGTVPLELRVRADEFYDFLEPVSIELSLRNLLPIPVTITEELHPEYGTATIYVRRPDGRVVEYMPISCKLADAATLELKPSGAEDGSDRHSRSVFVSYGRYGFYFDEPGQYYVRAVYHGPGNMIIPSNVCRLRIGHPQSREADRLAQDFFSYEAGCALYLGGSQSNHLRKGMDTLQEVVSQHEGTLVGAKTAGRIARGVMMPFHSVEGLSQRSRAAKLVSTKGDPERSIALTDIAIERFRDCPTRAAAQKLNFALERACRTRADAYMAMGQTGRAREELRDLAKNLTERGVKRRIVREVEKNAESISE